jgi:hypothetical protein
VTGPSQHIVIHPPPAKLVLTGFVPRVQIRQYVTMEHLWTARHAARLRREREPQLQPNVPDIEHRSLVMTAIFFGAGFLEALVNEVILDVVDPPAGGPSAPGAVLVGHQACLRPRRRPHNMDLPHVRSDGVRAATQYALEDTRWACDCTDLNRARLTASRVF